MGIKYKNKIFCGDSKIILKKLPSNSIDCCITSPPYWGLRDYQTATWVGGDTKCNHVRTNKITVNNTTGHSNQQKTGVGDAIYKKVCKKCGAKRVDKQIGLEATVNEYVQNIVDVCMQVYRVLKPSGTFWLNLGDTYSSHTDCKSTPQSFNKGTHREVAHKIEKNKSHSRNTKALKAQGLKNKDLIGVPWRVAFALQEAGWYLRQDIIWAKPNPMPESVKDRCTKAHEYIFLLTKEPVYYFNCSVISEEIKQSSAERAKRAISTHHKNIQVPGQSQQKINAPKQRDKNRVVAEKRNKRSVWFVPTKGYKGAHYATFSQELIKPCLLAGCPKGGVVLDPFLGSGTTAVLAKRYGRHYTGVELNKNYFNMAAKRLRLTKPNSKLTLFDINK